MKVEQAGADEQRFGNQNVDGSRSVPSGRRLGYGELAADATKQPVPANDALRLEPPAQPPDGVWASAPRASRA